MQIPPRMLILTAIVCLVPGACTLKEGRMAAEQENLGRGIVIGTVGVQQGNGATAAGLQTVAGEVVTIEGAAYVVRQFRGQERRVPVDQNTTIDRPAHVGDKIEAVLDASGRALRIRNIDDEYWRHE